jgi:hypothetical protein
MAVSTTNAFDGPFTANGLTTAFPFTFTAQTASDVRVLVDGADVSGYSVEIHADGGGTVSFDTAPATGSLLIWLDPDFAQTTAFEDGSAWLAGPVNSVNDRAALRDQALARDIGRGFMVPPGESGITLPTAAGRSGKYFAFDAQGAAVLLPGTSPSPAQASMVAMSGGDSVDSAVEAQRFPTVAAMLQSMIAPAFAGRPWCAAGYDYVEAPSVVTDYHLATAGGVLLYVRSVGGSLPVKAFGAIADGITDDAPAWNKAVTYLISLGGGVLDVPAGHTLLNSTVNINASSIWVRGSGHGASWIINGQDNAPALKFGDGATMYYRNRVSNVVFGQKAGVVAVAGNCGLYLAKQSNFMLDGLQVFQFPASLYDGVIFDEVTQSYMNTVGIQGCTNRGMYLFNQTFDIYMVNGRCDASAYGIEFRDCQGIQGANWTAYGNSVNAYRFTTSGNVDNNQFFFLTNFIGDTSGQHNWKIEQLSLSTLTNCWAATQQAQMGNYDGFNLSGTDVEDIAFNGCIAVSNNRHGMNIDYARGIQIIGGFYGSNFKPSAFGGLGARNGLAGSGSGILVGALADRVTIKGGKAENNASYGIDVVAGATKVEIEGIETRFNIAGAIRNSANSTSAECRIKNVTGLNPVGYIATPPVPASGTAITNLSGVDVMVYLAGGTLTGNVEISGNGVLNATNTGYLLPAGGSIKLSYSSAPSWAWNGF